MNKWLLVLRKSTVVLALALSLAGAGSGAADELTDYEFTFASELVNIGFPDFAKKVIDNLVAAHPDQKARADLIQAKIYAASGKFDQALEILNTAPAQDPKVQAIRLYLGNAYYANRQIDKAKQVYEAFFSQYGGTPPQDPDLLKTYQESAYTFAFMLKEAGDYKGAADNYRRTLQANLPVEQAGTVRSAMADCLVKAAEKASGGDRDALLKEADDLCKQTQWRGIEDPQFTESLCTSARIYLLRGDKKGAQNILISNLDLLKGLDEQYKEMKQLKLSPMAKVRFTLGELYQQEADEKKAANDAEGAIALYGKAVTEFANVFSKYGDSEYGPMAGKHVEEIRVSLKALGKELKLDLGQYRGKAALAEFTLPDQNFQQGNYQDAIKEYIKVLGQYPETEKSILALANLAVCYANTGDPLMVKVVCSYLAERFPANEKSSRTPLNLGKFYLDAQNEAMYRWLGDHFVSSFPQDDFAPVMLFNLGVFYKKKPDDATANQYFDRLTSEYPQSKQAVQAMSMLSWTWYDQKDYARAIKGFEYYIQNSQPGFEKAQAQFLLANSHQQVTNYIGALKGYGELITWLSPADSIYNTTPDVKTKNAGLLEKAMFNKGICLSRIKQPADKVPLLRAMGVKVLTEFLAAYPNSEMAPKAMATLGSLQLADGKFDAATAMFKELAEKYPNTDEGKDSLFALVRAAMEVDQFDVARNALADMVKNPDKYTPEKFNRIGQLMFDAGLYAEAIDAFKFVPGKTEDRALLERAYYGLGYSYYQTKNHAEAITNMEELLKRYPQSALFYEVKFTLGNCYRDAGRLDDAIATMQDIFNKVEDAVLINRANQILAQILIQKGDKPGALAAYKRVEYLADSDNQALRPVIEKCVLECIPLAMEMGKYKEAEESCDKYLAIFPGGTQVAEVRKWKVEAKQKASSAAPAPAVPAAP